MNILLVLFGIAAIAATIGLVVAPIVTRQRAAARTRRAVTAWARQQQQRAGR